MNDDPPTIKPATREAMRLGYLLLTLDMSLSAFLAHDIESRVRLAARADLDPDDLFAAIDHIAGNNYARAAWQDYIAHRVACGGDC